MMDQVAPKVNTITVNELRMSFLLFMPAIALLQARNPPRIPYRFLTSDVEFQKEYAKALTGTATLRTPWHEGDGKLFWMRYLPTKSSTEMWRALAPLKYDLSAHVTSLALTGGDVAARAYLYPWGIGVMVDVTLGGPLPLSELVHRAVEVRGQPRIEWKFDTQAGTSSPSGLAAAISERLRAVVYGDQAVREEGGELFSIVTVTDAEGVHSTEPIDESGQIHTALEGLSGWNSLWASITPTPLATARISARQAPAGHIVYGKRRGRAIWFPGDFRSVAAYSHTLSCFHQNLSMCSLHTESLCLLAQDAASELRKNGSLDAFSTTYRACAQLAAGILGRLHGKKTDEDTGQKPKTYRSGSIRTQIQMYKDDVNQLRLAIPTINSTLDA
jgi:hypothetical protein